MSELPEDTHLAYILSHEAWYANAMPDRRPEVNVVAAAEGGGCAWEFTVEEVDLGSHGPAIRVKVFDDGFAAFAQIPEFFAALAAENVTTLAGVCSVLDRIGVADETDRKGPHGETAKQSTAARIGKAIASMSVTRPGPDGMVQVNADNAAEAVLRILGGEPS